MAAKWTGFETDPSQIVHATVTVLAQPSGFVDFFISLLVFGAFAGAVLTTFDSYLIALTQGFMYDWYGLMRPRLRSVARWSMKQSNADDIGITEPTKEEKQGFVSASRFWLGFLGISAIVIAAVEVSLIDFWVGMYSLMLGFFPAVYFAIEAKESARKRIGSNWVIVSILLGFSVALLGSITGTFFGVTVYGTSATNIATVASLTLAACVIGIAVGWSKLMEKR